MDYGMIGKIEKAKRYAAEPERVTIQSFTVHIQGDNDSYTLHYGPEGWDCSCATFKGHGNCAHIMTMELLLKPMLKREPVQYYPGQNIVSDVEKARRYAQQTDRIRFSDLDVMFRGENSEHHTMLGDGVWNCTCDFHRSRAVCCHTMALERILSGMVPVTSVIAT
ncbi:MAG: SWIM zinc finger family protein [bacterium]|nr:SWIM zinc finger family protein [bacterium]